MRANSKGTPTGAVTKAAKSVVGILRMKRNSKDPKGFCQPLFKYLLKRVPEGGHTGGDIGESDSEGVLATASPHELELVGVEDRLAEGVDLAQVFGCFIVF